MPDIMKRYAMKTTPKQLYLVLFETFGSQHWWPMDTSHHQQNNTDPRFEVMVGAILTQNTAWINVEKAIKQLKRHNLLSIQTLIEADISLVKRSIRSSGYFNQKAKRLQNVAQYIQHEYQGDLNQFFAQSTQLLRKELLNLHGIGPETADSILLYAANKPVFVVDAYTKRLCNRLPLAVNAASYDEIQQFFQDDLTDKYSNQKITQIYNELHALIVNLGKHFCKPKPTCSNCPLLNHCQFGTKQVKEQD